MILGEVAIAILTTVWRSLYTHAVSYTR